MGLTVHVDWRGGKGEGEGKGGGGDGKGRDGAGQSVLCWLDSHNYRYSNVFHILTQCLARSFWFCFVMAN